MFANRRTRLLIALASVLLGISVLFPLWSVRLTAPQYPEGLGMYIWAHTVTGIEPQDLENINGLNHYIGMKRIEPDSIPELRIMRPGMLAMGVLGIGLALYGRRRLLQLWTAVLVLACVVGMADFYRWNYDYGHNLDPDAPLKVPGMSYQPPLFGKRVLLNFTATSLPATGGWLAIAGVSAALLAFVPIGKRMRRDAQLSNTAERALPKQTSVRQLKTAAQASMLVLAAGLLACAESARPIIAGVDACSYCRMTIDDARFAAQVITNTGKRESFDSIECMVSYVASLSSAATPREVLVADYSAPGQWLDASTALFVRSAALKSPMGRELAAFDPARSVDELRSDFGGEVLTWPEVQQYVSLHDLSHDLHSAPDTTGAVSR